MAETLATGRLARCWLWFRSRLTWQGLGQATQGATWALAVWLAGLLLQGRHLPWRVVTIPEWTLWAVLSVCLVALGLASRLLPWLWELLARWCQRAPLTRGDAALMAGVVLLLVGSWPSRQAYWTALLVLGGLALARVGFGFWAYRKRKRPAPSAVESEGDPLSAFLEQLSLEALDDEALDELGRKPLVDQLAQLVLKKPEGSFTLGVEGGWGSGKTTVLNFLAKRLEGEGLEIVRLSAWEYREPARLMRGYLERLEEALARTHDTFGLPKLFRRFASGLVSVSPGRLSGFLDKALGDLDHEGDEALRSRIEQVLKRRGKPLVVFVDDLDRIDADELQAILRAIRYFNQLPKLIHVLAYDRAQLSKTLFPDDLAGTRARDYLGKLVQLEISVGSAPVTVSWLAFSKKLDGLVSRLATETQARARRRIGESGDTLRLILLAARTSRELRRLLAACALQLSQPRLDLDVVDLLTITLLRHRFPVVHAMIAANQWLFTNAMWERHFQRDALLSNMGSEHCCPTKLAKKA